MNIKGDNKLNRYFLEHLRSKDRFQLLTSQFGRSGIRIKRTATMINLETYTQLQSFNHVSCCLGHYPSPPIALYTE